MGSAIPYDEGMDTIAEGMGTITVKSLYDTDFVEWADQTAALLREGRVDEIDFEHLIEEIRTCPKAIGMPSAPNWAAC